MKFFAACMLSVIATAVALAPVYRVDEANDGVRGRYVIKIKVRRPKRPGYFTKTKIDLSWDLNYGRQIMPLVAFTIGLSRDVTYIQNLQFW